MIESYGLTLVTANNTLLVSVEEACEACSVDYPPSGSLFGFWIEEATEALERETGRSFLNKTYDLTLDCFPCGVIEFPVNPVVSVSSVTYIDGNGDSQTWASSHWLLDTSREPARLSPAYGESWPTTQGRMNAVTIRFLAGYGTLPGNALERARHAVRLWVAESYRTREAGCLSKDAMRAWEYYVNKLRWKHYA